MREQVHLYVKLTPEGRLMVNSQTRKILEAWGDQAIPSRETILLKETRSITPEGIEVGKGKEKMQETLTRTGCVRVTVSEDGNLRGPPLAPLQPIEILDLDGSLTVTTPVEVPIHDQYVAWGPLARLDP